MGMVYTRVFSPDLFEFDSLITKACPSLFKTNANLSKCLFDPKSRNKKLYRFHGSSFLWGLCVGDRGQVEIHHFFWFPLINDIALMENNHMIANFTNLLH